MVEMIKNCSEMSSSPADEHGTWGDGTTVMERQNHSDLDTAILCEGCYQLEYYMGHHASSPCYQLCVESERNGDNALVVCGPEVC